MQCKTLDDRCYSLMKYEGRSEKGWVIKVLKKRQKNQNNQKSQSELVQLKLNIEASDGDSTPPEVYEESTPTYSGGVLKIT